MKSYLLIALAATAATLVLFVMPGPAAACDEFNLELGGACDNYDVLGLNALALDACDSTSLRLNLNGGYGTFSLRSNALYNNALQSNLLYSNALRNSLNNGYQVGFRGNFRNSLASRVRRQQLQRQQLQQKLLQQQLLRQQLRANQRQHFRSHNLQLNSRPSVDIRLRRGLFGNRSAGRIRIH